MSNLPQNFETDPDLIAGYCEDESGDEYTPDYLVRPGSLEEITECLKVCDDKKIGVTPAGKQTNDTASSLADGGVLLSTDKLKKIIEINKEEGYCIAEPGILLGDLKRELRDEGLFYPPDPTSENIASLGGTIATNASGARSYYYGPTNYWIQGLEVVIPGGKVLNIECPSTTKSTTGPVALSNLVNFWVGSEGVLGVVTKAKLRLLKAVPQAFAMLVFFKEVKDLVKFAVDLKGRAHTGLNPRAIEFMDNSCLNLLRESGEFPFIPKDAKGCMIIEEEYREEDFDSLLENWLEAIDSANALVDDTYVAESDSKIEELRELRHYIPATLNEHGANNKKNGGRKVSTDWAVGVEKLWNIFEAGEKICTDLGYDPDRTFRYGHLGDGHPHYNFIAKDEQDLKKAIECRKLLTSHALTLGGTVAAEHGIGKARKDLLALEGQNLKLTMLRHLKNEIDPNSIMAPGNIL